MADGLFSGPLANLLHKALGASALQHKVIADNIANIDTPGFKRSQVNFMNQLHQAILTKQNGNEALQAFRSHDRHFKFSDEPALSDINPVIEIDLHSSVRNDGNNVDIDREMSFLTENTILYNTLAQIVNSRLDGLRYAISEGRR